MNDALSDERNELAENMKPYLGPTLLWEGAEAQTYVGELRELRESQIPWAEGPWTLEPDHIAWTYKGVACLILRNPTIGILCGYVAVPEGHPWHMKHYSEIEDAVQVHGGLTFSSSLRSEPDVYRVGFDCGHYMDLVPAFAHSMREMAGLGARVSLPAVRYCDVAFVREEVERLVDQALEAHG